MFSGLSLGQGAAAYAFLPIALRTNTSSNSSSPPLRSTTQETLARLAAVGPTFQHNLKQLSHTGSQSQMIMNQNLAKPRLETGI